MNPKEILIVKYKEKQGIKIKMFYHIQLTTCEHIVMPVETIGILMQHTSMLHHQILIFIPLKYKNLLTILKVRLV
jgi:hypothetical protein